MGSDSWNDTCPGGNADISQGTLLGRNTGPWFSRFEILEELFPGPFSFADTDRVEMSQGFFGQGRDVGAADDGLDPPFPEAVADFIGVPDPRRYGGDGDQVGVHGIGIDIAPTYSS